MSKKALILGVTGQDGSYLADILLEKGYEVHGLQRKSATGNLKNLTHIISNTKFINRFFLHHGDMTDPTSIYRVINDVRPDEIYNEADQDHVRWSYEMVGYSADVTAAAVARLFEIVKQIDKSIKIFQPCTSNMFGLSEEKSHNEISKFNPQSPYAISKVFAYHMARYYREAYGMFISTAILFNHESPRRTHEYVSRKITNTVAKIKHGRAKKLILGDMSAEIDWGYARDYMEAAWQMLQLEKPDDFVIGSGKAHSVQYLVDLAFNYAGLNPSGLVEVSSEFIRPTKTSVLLADTKKAREAFDFSPRTSFEELIKLMMDHDVELEGAQL